MEKRYKNIGYFLMLLIPISFFGFYKTSYFIQFPNFDDTIDTGLHFHFVMACLWILMLIVQPILIKNRKRRLHKTIGRISYLVFPLLILSILPLIIKSIRETDNFMDAYFPIADSVLLLFFYSMAIYNKKNSAMHMRFMIGTALVFLGPTIGRIGPIFFDISSFFTQHLLYGIIYLILSILILLDKNNGKNYRPFVFIFIFFLFHQIGFYFSVKL